MEQNKKRDRVVPEDVIIKMIKNFQPPEYSEGIESYCASIWMKMNRLADGS